MHHDHDPYGTSTQTPGSLPRQLRGLVLGFVFDAKHLGKILAQSMASASLYAPACDWHKAFYRGGVHGASKLLVCRLVSLQDSSQESESFLPILVGNLIAKPAFGSLCKQRG